MGIRDEGRKERLRAVKQAASRLFRERGYEATTVRDIAEEAGVSTGTVMSCGDKATLLLDLLEDAIAELMPRSTRRGGSPANAVWQCFKPYFDFYASTPELARPYARILLSPAGRRHPALGAQAREFSSLVADQITARFAHVSRADAGLAAEALFAAYIHALVTWASDAATVDQAKAGLRRQIAWQLARFQK